MCILFLIALFPIMKLQQTMKWDIVDQFYPYRDFISNQIHQLKFPSWNPYINLGYPFYADPQSALFYPITLLLCAVTKYSVSMLNIEWLLHVIICGIGVFKLLRSRKVDTMVSLFSAIVFCLSGVFISNAQHLTWIISISWLPWIIYYYSKTLRSQSLRTSIGLAIVVFFSLTGGYPVFIMTITFLLFIHFTIFLFRKLLFRKIRYLPKVLLSFSLAIILFLVLSSPYLYSWFSIHNYVSRGSPLTYQNASVNPFSIQSLLTLVAPFTTAADFSFFHTDLSMSNGYIGFLVFVFLLWSFTNLNNQKYKIWLYAGIFLLLISMGSFLPFHKFLYTYLPGVNMFRHPSIFRVFAMLFFVIFFALRFQNLKKTQIKIWLSLSFLLSISILILILIVKPQILYSVNEYSNWFYKDHFLLNRILLNGILTTFISGIGLLAFFYSSESNFKHCILLLLIIEMVVVFKVLTPVTILSNRSIDSFNISLQDERALLPNYDSVRLGMISSIGNGSLQPMWYNTSMITRKIAFDGFNSFALNSLDSLNNSSISSFSKNSRLFETVYTSNSNNTFDYTSDSLLPSSIHVVSIAPDCFKAIISCPLSSTLQFQQAYHSCWTAKVNSKPSTISRLNYHLMGIQLASGKSEVEFKYSDSIVVILTFVSLFLFIILILSQLIVRFNSYLLP